MFRREFTRNVGALLGGGSVSPVLTSHGDRGGNDSTVVSASLRKGVLTLELRDVRAGDEITVRFRSSDGRRTWCYVDSIRRDDSRVDFKGRTCRLVADMEGVGPRPSVWADAEITSVSVNGGSDR